jgi:hypothetical protein
LVQFNGSQENGSLEISVLGVQLANSLIEGSNGGSFVSGFDVQRINNLVS